ncbi:MAG: rhomboid family intramembrane serine protease [Bacteroidales bacterium]|nr:rhomboid family intramembrane serine protease [Bacteroidales bacterium]
MNQYSPQGFRVLPAGVKNLIIINVIAYLATVVMASRGIQLDHWLALYPTHGEHFHFWQYLTYQFMHASFDHILFNMFALWMFGYVLENIWGTRRFLFFYLACGIGAGLVHTLITGLGGYMAQEAINAYAVNPNPDDFIQLLQHRFRNTYNPDAVATFVDSWRSQSGLSEIQGREQSVAIAQMLLDNRMGVPTVGASGAVYGILLAFGMMFPNERIYLYFLFPIKAKWFVIGYGLVELFLGVFHSADGIAHFAHLGGMIFGFILILYWRRHQFNRWN